MKIISDYTFGELEFDFSLFRSGYGLVIWEEEVLTELRIQADSLNDITGNQREAFRELEENKRRVVLDVESAVYNYYMDNCGEYRERAGAGKDEVAPLVRDGLKKTSRIW